MMSEGCRIRQVVKVNVEFVLPRHLPGFVAELGVDDTEMGGRKMLKVGCGTSSFLSCTWKVIPSSSSSSSSFSSSSKSHKRYSASSGRGLNPLVITPGRGSRMVPRFGCASCCHWWRVWEPSSGLTICNFSGRRLRRVLEVAEESVKSDKWVDMDRTLPLGLLQQLWSCSSSRYFNLLSHSSLKNCLSLK